MPSTMLTEARGMPAPTAGLEPRAREGDGEEEGPRWPRHILVASGGTPSAEHALAAARMLAAESGARVEVLSAYVPRIPLPACSKRRGCRRCEDPDRREAAEQLRAVRAQRRRQRPAGAVWPMRFEIGDHARIIAQVARESGADFVILGIGQESLVQRQRGNVTPIRVAEQLEVPLYAAAPGTGTLPGRAVLVLAEGEPHLATIRAIVRCLSSGAALWLAIGGSPDAASPAARARALAATARSLARIVRREACAARKDLSVDTASLDGHVVRGVLRLAHQVAAELIAVPMRGPVGALRELLPNVAGPLLLEAHCSVLVVPDGATEGGVSC